jgi:hypothetical protein
LRAALADATQAGLHTLDAKIAELTDNQATIQGALQALIAQIDRFLRGQQRNGRE